MWLEISLLAYVSVCLLSHIWLFVTPWTVACQAPLSVGILQARILEWVACPPPGDLPNPRTEPRPLTSQSDSLPPEPLGKPKSKTRCSITAREKHRQNTLGYKLQQFFLDLSPRVMETKINKWDLIKLKRFFIAKETILWKDISWMGENICK